MQCLQFEIIRVGDRTCRNAMKLVITCSCSLVSDSVAFASLVELAVVPCFGRRRSTTDRARKKQRTKSEWMQYGTSSAIAAEKSVSMTWTLAD